MADQTTTIIFVADVDGDKDNPDGKIEADNKSKDRIYSKTSEEFLEHGSYTIPKYSIWNTFTMSCKARRPTEIRAGTLVLKIGDQQLGDSFSVTNDYTTCSRELKSTSTFSPIKTNEDGYLTLTGVAQWHGTMTYNTTPLYLKAVFIDLTYTCPKFTITLNTNDSTMGTATFDNGSSSKEFDVIEKKQIQKPTITATPNDGYFFIKWSDGNVNPSREIVLEEANLTSNNTQLTYTAIFGKKELYVGSKRLDAIYVGTKKAKVYRGSTRIL